MDEALAPRRLRHVVIGVGALIFGGHHPALKLPAVEVAGVCDIREQIGRERAAELGAPFYADYRQMLADLRPDVAVVITPHYNHAEIAIDCLRAGCHVLVEKPMALEVAEADAMIEAARRAGKLLAVNFQHRHRPEVRAAARLIGAGQLGQLQRINLVAPWPRTERYYGMATWRATWPGEGGGVLMNQAPHDLDLVCHLAGQPNSVVGWTRTLVHHIEVEDTAMALLGWDNGATGYLYVSTAEAGAKPDIEIIGTGGTLQIGPGTLAFNRYTVDVRRYLLESDELWRGPDLEPVPVELEAGRADHVAVYWDLHAAILDGAPLAADGAQGRQSLELANALILSSHTRSEVRLPVDRAAYTALLASLKAGRSPT